MRAFNFRFPVAIGVALLTLSASAMAGVSARNAAASGSDPYARHREVSYSDLDLTRVADAAELYGRIERTAREVCRTYNGPTAKAVRIERVCAEKAIEDAVRSVSNTNLTAVHQSRTSKRAMVASSR
jgi:UrcA family protein